MREEHNEGTKKKTRQGWVIGRVEKVERRNEGAVRRMGGEKSGERC